MSKKQKESNRHRKISYEIGKYPGMTSALTRTKYSQDIRDKWRIFLNAHQILSGFHNVFQHLVSF